MITLWTALLVMIVNLLPVPAVFQGWHHPISTPSALTQYYFDRGLLLAYGFNHGEALRAFQTATKFDPDCAICYWGMAYVLGPNINTEMSANTIPLAWDAIQQALALQDHASASEQAYIQALATRYRPTPVADRSEFLVENLDQILVIHPISLRDPADLISQYLLCTWCRHDVSPPPTAVPR